MFKFCSVAAAALLVGWSATAQQAPFGIGHKITDAQIAPWNIDIRGDDGAGLPPGRGTVAAGEKLYVQQCASCHGEFGEGNGRWPELMGGRGTLTHDDPRKTIGSYWPWAPTVFDYVRRTMPFAAPQSLSDDETYSIVAYLLHLNDLLPADASLDAKALAAVRMPNRDGFIVGDPRPDVRAVPCMKDCKKGEIEILSDLAKSLGVTPNQRPKD
ncbi:MAG: cytochrome c [Alphaproteobacteria bacterium]|nr:cytochrome c [Alphaproteobacteria bacterium]